jgi:hypothetical protein
MSIKRSFAPSDAESGHLIQEAWRRITKIRQEAHCYRASPLEVGIADQLEALTGVARYLNDEIERCSPFQQNLDSSRTLATACRNYVRWAYEPQNEATPSAISLAHFLGEMADLVTDLTDELEDIREHTVQASARTL